jgi:hypothetical protein
MLSEYFCAACLTNPSLQVAPTTPDVNTSILFKHSPEKVPEEFQCIVDDFLTQCRPRMRELVENASHIPSFLPSWKPELDTDEALTKHISDLCIPAVLGGNPSLLLHDLGGERSDPDKH